MCSDPLGSKGKNRLKKREDNRAGWFGDPKTSRGVCILSAEKLQGTHQTQKGKGQQGGGGEWLTLQDILRSKTNVSLSQGKDKVGKGNRTEEFRSREWVGAKI